MNASTIVTASSLVAATTLFAVFYAVENSSVDVGDQYYGTISDKNLGDVKFSRVGADRSLYYVDPDTQRTVLLSNAWMVQWDAEGDLVDCQGGAPEDMDVMVSMFPTNGSDITIGTHAAFIPSVPMMECTMAGYAKMMEQGSEKRHMAELARHLEELDVSEMDDTEHNEHKKTTAFANLALLAYEDLDGEDNERALHGFAQHTAAVYGFEYHHANAVTMANLRLGSSWLPCNGSNSSSCHQYSEALSFLNSGQNHSKYAQIKSGTAHTKLSNSYFFRRMNTAASLYRCVFSIRGTDDTADWVHNVGWGFGTSRQYNKSGKNYDYSHTGYGFHFNILKDADRKTVSGTRETQVLNTHWLVGWSMTYDDSANNCMTKRGPGWSGYGHLDGQMGSFVTGHSLGGGQALFHHSYYTQWNDRIFVPYTYSPPAVHSTWYGTQTLRSYKNWGKRMYHHKDLVSVQPSFFNPFSLGSKHKTVKQQIKFEKKAKKHLKQSVTHETQLWPMIKYFFGAFFAISVNRHNTWEECFRFYGFGRVQTLCPRGAGPGSARQYNLRYTLFATVINITVASGDDGFKIHWGYKCSTYDSTATTPNQNMHNKNADDCRNSEPMNLVGGGSLYSDWSNHDALTMSSTNNDKHFEKMIPENMESIGWMANTKWSVGYPRPQISPNFNHINLYSHGTDSKLEYLNSNTLMSSKFLGKVYGGIARSHGATAYQNTCWSSKSHNTNSARNAKFNTTWEAFQGNSYLPHTSGERGSCNIAHGRAFMYGAPNNGWTQAGTCGQKAAADTTLSNTWNSSIPESFIGQANGSRAAIPRAGGWWAEHVKRTRQTNFRTNQWGHGEHIPNTILNGRLTYLMKMRHSDMYDSASDDRMKDSCDFQRITVSSKVNVYSGSDNKVINDSDWHKGAVGLCVACHSSQEVYALQMSGSHESDQMWWDDNFQGSNRKATNPMDFGFAHDDDDTFGPGAGTGASTNSGDDNKGQDNTCRFRHC